VDGSRVLIVDDDSLIREVVGERLQRAGFEVAVAGSLAEARAVLKGFSPDLALLDIKLPDGQGTELLESLTGEEGVPSIMITAHGTVESAVEALRKGAADYLEKPFSFERLEATLRTTLERTNLRREVQRLRQRHPWSGDVVGSSPAMQSVMTLVERIAPATGSTVLIGGETGTGKGLIAHMVHRLSDRASGPFVNVTCSALAESIMESELFGHEKGAFTDAHVMKRGLAEVAHGGTLFLDEIAELSTGVQAKLLRFIEEKVLRRVGGTVDIKVDVRVVAATNRDLEREVEEGRFRSDLYYRLRVLPIVLPPLRHRREDIPALTLRFIDTFNAEFGKKVVGLEPEALDLLLRHPWPGNVRELRNAIERAVLLTDGPQIQRTVFPPELTSSSRTKERIGAFEFGANGLDLEDLERRLLREALRRTDGNKTEAGKLLGLSRHQIRNRLHKFKEEL
jgi:two-component system response regulator AtoC